MYACTTGPCTAHVPHICHLYTYLHITHTYTSYTWAHVRIPPTHKPYTHACTLTSSTYTALYTCATHTHSIPPHLHAHRVKPWLTCQWALISSLPSPPPVLYLRIPAPVFWTGRWCRELCFMTTFLQSLHQLVCFSRVPNRYPHCESRVLTQGSRLLLVQLYSQRPLEPDHGCGCSLGLLASHSAQEPSSFSQCSWGPSSEP